MAVLFEKKQVFWKTELHSNADFGSSNFRVSRDNFSVVFVYANSLADPFSYMTRLYRRILVVSGRLLHMVY